MPRQIGVVHEAEVGRAKFGAQAGLPAAGRQQGAGASAAGFDSQIGGREAKKILLRFKMALRFLQGETGLTGQVSFCHAFFGAGAYYFMLGV
jgi:hypothetical protein